LYASTRINRRKSLLLLPLSAVSGKCMRSCTMHSSLPSSSVSALASPHSLILRSCRATWSPAVRSVSFGSGFSRAIWAKASRGERSFRMTAGRTPRSCGSKREKNATPDTKRRGSRIAVEKVGWDWSNSRTRLTHSPAA